MSANTEFSSISNVSFAFVSPAFAAYLAEKSAPKTSLVSANAQNAVVTSRALAA